MYYLNNIFFLGRKCNDQDQPKGRDRDYKRLIWHKSNKVNQKIKMYLQVFLFGWFNWYPQYTVN